MKWALGGVTLIAVIAITAAVSIALTKGSGGGGNGTASATASPSASASGTASNTGGEIASANDTGPVNIITEDPTCDAWAPINKTFLDIQQKGWNKRDANVPASEWSSEVRAQYEEVAKAARAAADQSVALARKTPHRVMREFYEQFIAYARAYSDAVENNYTPAANYLAGTFLSSSIVIVSTCDAITWKSAQAHSGSVPEPAPPSSAQAPGNIDNPERFIASSDGSCEKWGPLLDQYNSDTATWAGIDANLPASKLSEEQKAITAAVIPIMNKFADDIEKIGRDSANPVVQDFAVYSAQYRRAYASALPTYTSRDSYLDTVSGRAVGTILQACKAVEG